MKLPKPFEHNFNEFNVDGMGLEQKTMKEFQNVDFYDLNGHEKNVNPSSIANDSEFASKFDNTDSIGRTVNFQEDEENKSRLPCTYSNRESVPVQKVSDKLYMDETIRECELPELTVCYKESIENVVKDICVDEGVPCKDRVLFDTRANESKIDKACSLPENEQRSEPAKGVDYPSVCNSDGRKCLGNNVLEKESHNQCDLEYPVWSGNAEDFEEYKNSEYKFKETTYPLIVTSEPSGKANDCSTDKTEYDNIKETTSPVNVNPSANVFEGNSDANGSNKYGDQCTQVQAIPNVEANLGSFASVPKSEGPGKIAEETAFATRQCTNAESDSTTPVLCEGPSIISEATSLGTNQSCANAELDSATTSNELVCNQAAPNGSSNSNCGFSALAQNSGGERPRNDLRELLQNENASRIEGGPSDRWLVSSNRFQNGNGETSFSMTGAISGRISYSGPIPYSGSVSMRSDSSTTSARSFAFPVLQAEWNSSPVRMAKADRRRLRKNRHWKDVLCCKF